MSINYGSTIITMFFNMKKLKDSTELTRPFEFYINNCKPVLKLDYPMVIFCDEDTYPPIKEIRDGLVNNNKTKYIIKNIEQYEYYQSCWHIITENRIKNGTPLDKRNTASYLLMGMFKAFAFNYVNQHNYFNTSHYAWIDIGCNHVVREIDTYAPKMLDNPQSKITACYIHYRGRDEIINMKEYMKYGGPCGIASTAYTIEASYVSKFYTSMFSIFYEHLYNEVGHTDETVMCYCYDKYPDIFNIYGGDYGSVFINYHKPIQDIHIITWCFIQNAIKYSKFELAKTMARKVLESNNNLEASIKDYLQNIVS